MFPRGPPKPRQDAADDKKDGPSVSGVGRPAGWSMEAPNRRGGTNLFGEKNSQVSSKPDDPAGMFPSLHSHSATGPSSSHLAITCRKTTWCSTLHEFPNICQGQSMRQVHSCCRARLLVDRECLQGLARLLFLGQPPPLIASQGTAVNFYPW